MTSVMYDQRTPLSWAMLEIHDRKFVKHWTMDNLRYSLSRYNRIHCTSIKCRYRSVAGCEATGVAPAIIIERVL